MQLAKKLNFYISEINHENLVKVIAMKNHEYNNISNPLNINYSFALSPFGNVIIASTDIGICHLHFYTDENKAISNLQSHFPNANFSQRKVKMHHDAMLFFQNKQTPHEISLHVKGTKFQIKVWESLLQIPLGSLSSYGSIAKKIGNPKAYRAVGSAVGKNPITIIIPCHRVIKKTGQIGNYMGGVDKKIQILGWELGST